MSISQRRSLLGLACVAALAGGALLGSRRAPPAPASAPELALASTSFDGAASITSRELTVWLDQVARGGGSSFAPGTHAVLLSPDGARALELRIVARTGETPVAKLWVARRLSGTMQSSRLVETPHALEGAYALRCAPTPQVWSHDGLRVALVARGAAAFVDLDGEVTTIPPAREATLAPTFHPAEPRLYFLDAGSTGYDVRVHDLASGASGTVHTEAAGSGLALVASPSALSLAWLHVSGDDDRSTAQVAVCDVRGAERLFAGGDVLLPPVGVEEPLLRWTPDGRWLLYRDHSRGEVCAYDAATRRTARLAGPWTIAGALDGLLQLRHPDDGRTALVALDRPAPPGGPTAMWVSQGASRAPYPALVRQRVVDQAIVSWGGGLRWWAPGDREP